MVMVKLMLLLFLYIIHLETHQNLPNAIFLICKTTKLCSKVMYWITTLILSEHDSWMPLQLQTIQINLLCLIMMGMEKQIYATSMNKALLYILLTSMDLHGQLESMQHIHP